MQIDDVQGHLRINAAGRNVAWGIHGLVLNQNPLDGGAPPLPDGAGDDMIAKSGEVVEGELRGNSGKIRSAQVSTRA